MNMSLKIIVKNHIQCMSSVNWTFTHRPWFNERTLEVKLKKDGIYSTGSGRDLTKCLCFFFFALYAIISVKIISDIFVLLPSLKPEWNTLFLLKLEQFSPACCCASVKWDRRLLQTPVAAGIRIWSPALSTMAPYPGSLPQSPQGR